MIYGKKIAFFVEYELQLVAIMMCIYLNAPCVFVGLWYDSEEFLRLDKDGVLEDGLWFHIDLWEILRDEFWMNM